MQEDELQNTGGASPQEKAMDMDKLEKTGAHHQADKRMLWILEFRIHPSMDKKKGSVWIYP